MAGPGNCATTCISAGFYTNTTAGISTCFACASNTVSC